MSGFAEVASHMHGRYSQARYTVGLPCEPGGTGARKTLSRYHCWGRQITSFAVWNISGGGIYLTHITISRQPLWMLCR